MLVSRDTTRDILLEESVGADAWAARNGWLLEWDFDALTLRAQTSHPADGLDLYLSGSFDDYRALAPDWLFTTGDRATVTAAAWPAGGNIHGQSSIMHSVGVMCAHFNRRAYREFKGPHADGWGSSQQWLDVSEGVQARTIADMLAVIDAHIRVSPGRMG
jgi:hypothetical protein